MLNLLAKVFIKETPEMPWPEVRRRYGVLCGAYGIFLNLLMSLGKLLAGSLSGSIAITADALNNLSDATSSVITMVGFRLSGKKPDADHPFGHGRFEYVSGLIVSMVIVVMGFELMLTSVRKILTQEPVSFSPVTLGILLVSILLKLYMMLYNRRIGKRFSSATLRATAADSLSDCIATTVVLLCMVIGYFFSLSLDGYAGALVALFILYTGISAAKEIISQILGNPPDPDLVQKIHDLVMESDVIVGIHDMIVHDYGPGKVFVSLHAEVPMEGNVLELHDAIDNVELRLRKELGCLAVIHMDPIATQDKHVAEVRSQVAEKIRELDPAATIHDFRMVPGTTHNNLIFDVVVPFQLKLLDDEIIQRVDQLVKDIDSRYNAVVEVDRSYIG